MIIVESLLWLSIGLIVYSYVGYPLIAWGLSRVARDPLHQALDRDFPAHTELPHVSLLIAAYREETVILERLQNALLLDYPADRLEIIIGCDGNEDTTADLVRTVDDPRVRLLAFPERRGKASVLNDGIAAATRSLIVFSDANTMFDRDALKKLVQPFRDHRVGAVCGQLILVDPDTGNNVDGIYWKYENFIKRCEARLGALLGCNGAIYAMRRDLYEPLSANTIVDDFVIGMRVHQRGRRLLLEPAAIAREETPETMRGEFGRRSRIGAGGIQSLRWLSALLSPTYGYLAWAFWSHKVLRWACPFLLLTAILCNVLLIDSSFYTALLAVQAGFYGLAMLGNRLPGNGVAVRLARLPGMFVEMNAALAVGLWRCLSGIRSGTWKRTERTSTPVATGAGQ